MSSYHNGMVPSRYPNYPRNTVPPEAMYGQFPRGPGMNKPFQHDPQSQGMFPNYQQQGQHPPGYMYQQQASNMAAYQMERQRAAQRGGVCMNQWTAFLKPKMVDIEFQISDQIALHSV